MILLKKPPLTKSGGFKASTRIELVIEVLQTFALPLGYDALSVTPTGFEPMLSP
jgi:hypothetical protein